MIPKKIPNNDLWNRGIQLHHAPYSYAPKSEKEEHKRLHNVSAIEAATKAAKETHASGITGAEALSAIFSASNPILTARIDWNARMRALVLHHLERRNLFAYGFEPPRRMDSQSIELPAAYWKGHIRWDKATLSAQGLEFFEIRILSKRRRDELIAEQLPRAEFDKPQAGRPSIKLHIQETFLDLKSSNNIDINAPAKSHYPLVREHMRNTYPDLYPKDRKLGDEGIRSHFSPLFNELKKNRKQ